MSTRSIDGIEVPRFFYGTAWKEDETTALTTQALEAGFRAIDTANQRKHYYEAGVGEAIRGFPRDELFLQTKFTFRDGQDDRLPYDARAPIGEQVAQSFASSLDHLGVDRIDSYVLHGPSRARGLGDEDFAAWRAMEDLHAAGKVRFLGVSNVAPDQLETLLLSRVRPTFVQNRCYAERRWDAQVRAICDRHGLVYQGFSLLTANDKIIRTSRIAEIARARGRTNAQIVFAFALAIGMIPLTGSSDAKHLREDLDAASITLDPSEIEAIERAAER
jgi:diketogulonate reductase-like aldo/keto reductase